MTLNLVNNPAVKVQSESGLSIRFHEGYSTTKYQLFEVPDEKMLESILSGKEQMKIKNYVPLNPQEGRKPTMAALSTQSETFKIKKAQNTNKWYVLDVQTPESLGAELYT